MCNEIEILNVSSVMELSANNSKIEVQAVLHSCSVKWPVWLETRWGDTHNLTRHFPLSVWQWVTRAASQPRAYTFTAWGRMQDFM